MELLHWGVARSAGASLLSDVLRSYPLQAPSPPRAAGDSLFSLLPTLRRHPLPVTRSLPLRRRRYRHLVLCLVLLPLLDAPLSILADELSQSRERSLRRINRFVEKFNCTYRLARPVRSIVAR